jgi:hypothetical protein
MGERKAIRQEQPVQSQIGGPIAFQQYPSLVDLCKGGITNSAVRQKWAIRFYFVRGVNGIELPSHVNITNP